MVVRRDRSAFPQTGIFSLGTGAQVCLELDRTRSAKPVELVRAIAGAREPRTTMAGVNLVVGFRPELWRRLRARGVPPGLTGFDRALRGAEGFVMPATQHDAVVWFAGHSLDVVFDEARALLASLDSLAHVAEETVGWPYRQDRDLTGFIDGTENPTLAEAADVALVPEGRAGAGGSVLLLQKWRHEARRWEGLSTDAQERVIGRRKPDSAELDPQPPDSHVHRTDQDAFGKIFRRNFAYGGVTDHGTMFVGFCSERRPLERMLRSMAGVPDGVRDALTRYTRPLTGAYYFVPSLPAVREFADPATG
jgi:porphyrinogen peroxidase